MFWANKCFQGSILRAGLSSERVQEVELCGTPAGYIPSRTVSESQDTDTNLAPKEGIGKGQGMFGGLKH